MKRFFVLAILTAIVTSCLFADTGTIQFKFKLNKYQEESVEPFFTDTSKNSIETYELDLSKKTDTAQVYLAITTNKKISYKMKLTFFPMIIEGEDYTSYSFSGAYNAQVYDPDYVALSSDVLEVAESKTSEGVSIEFDGPTVTSSNKPVTYYYPISFDFTSYIDNYPAGNVEGTVKVEVSAT